MNSAQFIVKLPDTISEVLETFIIVYALSEYRNKLKVVKTFSKIVNPLIF